MVFQNVYLKWKIIIMSPSGNLYKYCTTSIWSCYIGQVSAKTSICTYSGSSKESVECKQGLV